MARAKSSLITIIVSLTISNSLQRQYERCPNPWNPNESFEHTMNLYSEQSFGAECNKVEVSYLTEEERHQVFERHNELRGKVARGEESRGIRGGQPRGIIGPLQWDDELALVAQRWANQCVFDHDKCRDIGSIGVGQNLGYQGSSDGFRNKFPDIVTAWYDEVKDFDNQLVSKYQGQMGAVTTHYTQLIWAKTTRIGCGGVKHITADGFYRIHLVCNYSPRGNIINEAVYSFKDESVVQSPPYLDVEAPPIENVEQVDNELVEPPPDALEEEKTQNDAGWVPNDPPIFIQDRILEMETTHKPVKPISKYTFRKAVHSNTEQHINKIPKHGINKPINTIWNKNRAQNSQTCRYQNCKDKSGHRTYLEHTMCLFRTPKTASRCKLVKKSFLSETDEKKILYLHNERRRHFSFQPLKWNIELANVAQRWANQCIYDYDKCRNIHGIEVVQHVGQTSDEGEFISELPDIVTAWYREGGRYDLNPLPQLEMKFTDVGCGGLKYRDDTGLFKTYLVCNYMSSRNLIGQLKNKHIGEPKYKPVMPTSIPAIPIPRLTANSHDCQYPTCQDPKNPRKISLHTMCRYPTVSLAPRCSDVLQPSIKLEEKQKILQAHNQLMLVRNGYNTTCQLQWNNELELIAQRWANQCDVGHDTCRNLKDGSHVRQRCGISRHEFDVKVEVSDMINSWNTKKPFENDLTDVGCGLVKYKDAHNLHNVHLVCNYK